MADYAEYNRDMQYTLSSKLFFLPHIPLQEIKQVVDFGCANAALLKLAGKVMPGAYLCGIDSDVEQRRAAMENLGTGAILPSLSYFWQMMRRQLDPRLLILTSVMHEVASLPGSWQNNIVGWWEYVESFGFDYIAIRDFSVPAYCRDMQTPQQWLDVTCMDPDEYGRMVHVSERYGSCNNLYNFMHYLLKRPYVENWEREMQEDYLFADTDQLLKIVTGSGKYSIKHKRLCRSKVFEKRTIKDLGFLPPVTTHIELVLVRNHSENHAANENRETTEHLAEAG